jgi:flagellin
MALTIGSNTAALTAQFAVSRAQDQLGKSIKALSSGSRFSTAAEDAAGYAIAESLRAQISGVKQGAKNAENAGSMVQIAEGALNEQNNILLRMRELSIQSASDTVSDQEREFMHNEFEQLGEELDRIAVTTRYGSLTLLGGENDADMSIQVGPYNTDEDVIKFRLDADTRASTLKVESLSLRDQDDALDSLETIDEALTAVSGIRANYGAIQERLEFAKNNNDVHYEGLSEARSRIADTDVAAESSKLVRSQIMQQVSVAMLAQANTNAGLAMRLLG